MGIGTEVGESTSTTHSYEVTDRGTGRQGSMLPRSEMLVASHSCTSITWCRCIGTQQDGGGLVLGSCVHDASLNERLDRYPDEVSKSLIFCTKHEGAFLIRRAVPQMRCLYESCFTVHIGEIPRESTNSSNFNISLTGSVSCRSDTTKK